MANLYQHQLKNFKFSLKIFWLMVLMLFLNSYATRAQIANSSFTSYVDTYQPITGGTIAFQGVSTSNTPLQNVSIGFDFNFGGTLFSASNSTISISPNGFISLQNSNSESTTPISSLNYVISALGGDLAANSASVLRYKIEGSIPNRVFVIQWESYIINSNPDNINFQIRLYESEEPETTSNRIEFSYGDFYIFYGNLNAQVGLRGASAADFHNRKTVEPNYTWTDTEQGVGEINAVCSTAHFFEDGLYPPSGLVFSFTTPNVNLPIVLENFTGTYDSKAVTLNWKTSVEINNDHFEIEKSTDGKEFEVIGIVKGSGNMEEEINYQYVDNAIYQQGYYYRLKQVDFNGDYDYSNIIFIQTPEITNTLLVGLYPNPTTSDNISFSINSPDKTKDFSVFLFSLDGKVLMNKTFSSQDINSYITLENQGDITPKTYYLKVTQGNYSVVKPVILR